MRGDDLDVQVGAKSDFAWTTEHILLCRLISLYGKCATKPGANESWIRNTPLNVLIYECISAGVLDFDYSPILTDVSHHGVTKKVRKRAPDATTSPNSPKHLDISDTSLVAETPDAYTTCADDDTAPPRPPRRLDTRV